jgi:hypothetical protein
MKREKKQTSAMERLTACAAISMLCSGSLAAGCDSSSNASTGEVRVDLSGEEASVQGYPVGSGEDEIAFVDGFTLQFSKVLVSLERFDLAGADGSEANLDADSVVADLHLGEPEAWVFEGVPSRRWEDVSYVLAPATESSRPVNDVTSEDLQAMIDGGYALWIAGNATDGLETYAFDLRFEGLRVLSEACFNGLDETDGLVVPRNAVVQAQVTVHLDHLFFDTFATDEALLRFEPWAAAAGEDGIVTLDDLETQPLADLRDRNGDPLVDGEGSPIVYDPGPLSLSANNLREYVVAAATTTGHFNGEGHCDYVVE